MRPEVPSVLQEIVAHKQEEVAAAKGARPRIALDGLPPTRDFAGALRRRSRIGRCCLIAEVKHASPVKGVLRPDFDAQALARTYAANGAAAISVLTDVRFFQGHPDYLRQIREVVPVPLLRKEFIVDEWQIPESRSLGADAILLIVAILSPNQLRDYLQAAQSMGMDVLVEVHTDPELEVALASGARIIGVNNRDLNTFVTDLATTERFASRVKAPGTDRLLVSESGINSGADVTRVAACGADAILVGESLVREPDPAPKVQELSGYRSPCE